MIIDEWAQAWAQYVPQQAVADLKARLGILPQGVNPLDVEDLRGTGEALQQQMIRLRAAKAGIILHRNNVGALLDERGVPIRYGLANESKRMNDAIKSADLIGIKPVKITFAMVGLTIGQFYSVECKHLGWKFNPNNKHEQAQAAWAEHVINYGGHAQFASCPEDLKGI
jgi:hypothetical protein